MALPVLWIVSAVVVGSFGMTAEGGVGLLVVLAAALFAGLGHKWAYAAVVVLGVLLVAVGTVDPGMLSAFLWLVGGLYAVLGLALLVASFRRPRQG